MTQKLNEMGNHAQKISLEDETEISNKLHEENAYVREFIITHIDSKDEILQLEPLLNYINIKFDNCEDKYKNWNSFSFQKKENLFSDEFTEDDFNYFRKKGWIKN